MNIFVNNAINDALVIYLQSRNNNNLEYNSFMVCVIRMLMVIYGEDEILNAFYEKDNVAFDMLLKSFGYEDVDLFKDSFESFYEFNIRQEERQIKKKNKYFNLVQKYLVDMFQLRCSKEFVSDNDKKEFKDLLFTYDSKDFCKKSYTLLMAYNPYELDEYMKKINFLGE